MNSAAPQHTPGPWRAIPKLGTRGLEWHVVNKDGGLIAEIDGKPNAALIAEAPELLIAAANLLQCLEQGCMPDLEANTPARHARIEAQARLSAAVEKAVA